MIISTALFLYWLVIDGVILLTAQTVVTFQNYRSRHRLFMSSYLVEYLVGKKKLPDKLKKV